MPRKKPAPSASDQPTVAPPVAVEPVVITDDMMVRAADLAVRGRRWSQIAADLNLDVDAVRREMSAGRGHQMIQEARAEIEMSIDMLHVNLKQAALTTLGQGLRADRVVHVHSETGVVTKVEDWAVRISAARAITQTPLIEITQTVLVGIASGEDEHLDWLAARADAFRESLTGPHVVDAEARDQDDPDAPAAAEGVTGTG